MSEIHCSMRPRRALSELTFQVANLVMACSEACFLVRPDRRVAWRPSVALGRRGGVTSWRRPSSAGAFLAPAPSSPRPPSSLGAAPSSPVAAFLAGAGGLLGRRFAGAFLRGGLLRRAPPGDAAARRAPRRATAPWRRVRCRRRLLGRCSRRGRRRRAGRGRRCARAGRSCRRPG